MAGVSATGEHNAVTRFVIIMAGGCFLAGVTALLVVILVPSGEARFRTTQPTLVEFGIFVAGDSTCFFKRIFKGQKSPVVFSLQSPTLINYVKIEMANTNIRKGGISAQILNGATATVSLTVEITDGSLKSVFTNDVDVTMLCTPPAG
ncbi:uncharacterized protein LOC120415733 [Culex pipiens pallens]|uniref:uncharacterized protein LOC120415733 n=1 Tax=Culex pipiens pallens TaxID=42434 RepID=UPI00195371B4|nr:uncharacterized protein LOC120415733 [Culex pipiens pallens]